MSESKQANSSSLEQQGRASDSRMNGPGPGGAHPFPNWGGDDNDSFKYLSEPSLSEECDSSTADRRSLLTPDDDDDYEVDDEDRGATSTPPPPPPGPPPPLNSGASSGMASPGNTSLSSWESHFRPPNSRFHRVKIQFSPDSAQSSERHQYTGYGPNFYQPFQSAFYNNSSQPYQQQQQFLVPMSPLQQQQQQQQQQALTNNINETQAFSSNDLPNAAPDEEEEEDNPNNLSYSTFSYSTVSSSAKDRMRVDEFSSDLKQNSEGALQKSSEANNISMLNTSIDSSQYPKATLDTVMRNTPKEKSQDREHEVPGRHRRISSVDTELIGNTSDVVLEDNEDRYGEDTSSFMMTLSASEDEEGDQKVGDNSQSKEGATESKNNHDRIEKDSNGQHSRMKDGSGTSSAGAPASSESNHTSTEDDPRQVDSDHHQHSADDEQTTFRPPRKRIFAGGKPSPAHRRTRSGDSAAAALATGGKDWRGMDKDKIPLPIADDEDEDDEDNLAAVAPNNGKSDSGQDNNGSGKNRNGKKTNNSNNKDESAVFSVGAAEVAAASRAAARRQRREQRQEQRLLAEKTAAAAKEQRIKRQYQEFSNSPLWNYNKQYRDRVDSQDHQSLGSIPSTIVHPIKEQSHGDDERERPRPRLSFDTKSSIISSTRGDFGGDGLNRRDSESMFSRISHSQHSPEESPSPHLPRRSFQVYHQMGSPPMHGRHQRAHTLISGYGPIESRIQHQDSFRRYMQMQMQNQDPNHDSFHRYTIAQHHRSPDSHGSYRARSFPGHPLASSLGRDVYSPAWGGYRRRASPTSQSDSNNSSRSSESTSANRGEEEDEFMDIHANQTHQIPPSMFGSLDEVEQSVEAELLKHGSYQHVVRHARGSPFANFGRKSANDTSSSKFDRSSFLPKTSIIQEGGRGYPTYRCPNCQTIQREFFTVTNAPRHYEMASRYLALYFSIYVIASLYIFGLEENWHAIDCIYFAVITLTTAGLGDFVPTTDTNKVICSIFIYFGVACIGLLLGSYIANMLDVSARRKAKENRLKSCPNCARLKNIKDVMERRQLAIQPSVDKGTPAHFYSSERPSGPAMYSPERVNSGSGYHAAVYSPERHSHHHDPDHASKKIKREHDNSGSSSDSTPNSSPLRPPPETSTQKDNLSQGPIAFPTSSYAFPAVTNPQIPPTIPEVSANLVDQHEAKVKAPIAPQAEPKQEHVPTPPPAPPYSASEQKRSPPPQISPRSPGFPLGSPMAQVTLGRQNHTRHASIDVDRGFMFAPRSQIKGARNFSFDFSTPPISEYVPFARGTAAAAQLPPHRPSAPRTSSSSMRFDSFLTGTNTMDDEASVSSSDSFSYDEPGILDLSKARVKTAKYVFLTLKNALVNSLVIIGVGCVGFWFIERFSLIDSWYFTTVLLTSVGYGDIVPVTKGGKLFATVYILVAGTILLNNMSTISMIPLELRKRRTEQAILTQFGDLLDDDALRELASGPLIQRLHLSANRPDGLNECTREMFALAMLVRLGKVSEDDILETFDAFRRLDVNNDGVLNSRSIIAGMIHKRRRDNMRHVASSNDMLKEKSVLSVTGADNNAGSAPASYEMEYPPYWAATQNPSTFQQLHNSAQFSNQVTTPASETERTSLLARRRNYGTHHMRSMSG